MENDSRRTFIKKSSLAAAGIGLASSLPYSMYASVAPSDQINIGVIGLGFGMVNMRKMLDGTPSVRCVALCDVDKVILENEAAGLKKDYPDATGNLKLYSDFRKLLDNKDIHGVIISTPDHWHTYIYAEATKAGKAIYIEKPTGHSIADCNLMIDLQKKYQNVVTTGLWHASLEYFIDAFKILESGVLGNVYKVHTWITKDEKPLVYTTPQEIPDTFDYKMWQGHAENHPYAQERIDNWRFFWPYGGGRQTDWLHYLDSAFDGLMALGYGRAYPRSVYSAGYRKAGSMMETPAGQTTIYEFDNYQIVWEHQVTGMYGRGDGVAWIGSNGTLVCNRMGYEVIPKKVDKKDVIEAVRVDGSYGNQYNHMANWAQCIKDNNPNTNSPISKGSFVSAVACMGNISYQVGTSLEYLPEENRFKNNPEADAFIKPEYNNGWEYPTV